MEANMASEPPKLSQYELARRQALIDATWKAHLNEQEHRREVAEARSFHKSPQDPDFNLR
jgi:hypothetical protein